MHTNMVSAPPQSWLERKQELKKDIVSYFHKSRANIDQIKAACEFIKAQGELMAWMDFGQEDEAYDEYLEDFVIPEKFTPTHRNAVLEFCRRYNQLHFEVLQHLESQRWWRERSYPPTDNSTHPKAEVVISHENIVIKALEPVEGFSLPAEAVFMGNSCYELPLNKRWEAENLGYPVLLYPGVGSVVVEKFDSKKFRTEKVSFEIWSPVFNVSEGLQDYEALGCSPLWRGKLHLEQFQQELWSEIQVSMPRLQQGSSPSNRCLYLGYLMRLVKLAQSGERVKLIYRSDEEHAVLIQRCIYWLASQLQQVKLH